MYHVTSHEKKKKKNKDTSQTTHKMGRIKKTTPPLQLKIQDRRDFQRDKYYCLSWLVFYSKFRFCIALMFRRDILININTCKRPLYCSLQCDLAAMKRI